MNLRIIVARWGFAFALLVAWTSTGFAFTCATPGDLQANMPGTGGTLTVSGTCTSNGSPFSINNDNVTLDGGGSAILKDQVFVTGRGVTVKNFIINGSSPASGANTGVVVDSGGSAVIANCNINTWGADGVDVDRGASASIVGGQIDIGNSTGTAINVFAGAKVGIGYDPFNSGLDASVEITGNGTGVNIAANASVTILQPNIFSNHLAGVSVASNAAVEVISGIIEDNLGDGLDVTDGATVVFNASDLGGSGTATNISGNHGLGISMEGGTLDIDVANIGTNDSDGIDATAGATITIRGGAISGNFGGGLNVNSSSVKLRGGVSITGNSGAPPITATFSTLDDKGGSTITAPGSLGLPAILAYRSGLDFNGTHVNGPTNSNALGAFGGTSVLMYQATLFSVDASDAALQIADGSSVVSAGGNTISNTSGNAITATNGSTFDEQTNAVLTKIFTPTADTITGGGTVQMQSNMELGTGASVPSSWTGSISVAQNSSFRMHGGMTISGGVALTQGSNGFFNKVAGGSNTVNGTHVTCTGTGTSHVVGPNSVMPAVGLVAAGAGCYAF